MAHTAPRSNASRMSRESDPRNAMEAQDPGYNGGRLGDAFAQGTAAPRDHSLLAAVVQLSSIVDDGQKQLAELTELVDRLCKDVVGESDQDTEGPGPARPSFSPLDARLINLGDLFRGRQEQIDRLRRALGL